MTGRMQLVAAAALLALLSHTQDPMKLLGLEQKFREQTDPVRQAKALAKLGPEEIRAAQGEIQAGQVDQALARLRRFRDNARKVQRSLEASGINAVKKPGGFEELQIAVRESVRRLRDIIFGLSLERRGAFQVVQQDLDQVNNQLLQDLFPPPPPPPKPRKPKHKKTALSAPPPARPGGRTPPALPFRCKEHIVSLGDSRPSLRTRPCPACPGRARRRKGSGA